jgi:hypothetical protein
MFHVEPEHRPVVLSDLYDITHRLKRMGMRSIEVIPHEFSVRFYDHRYRSDSALTAISELDYWYWRFGIDNPKFASFGPLGEGRYLLLCPAPRKVIVAYEHEVRTFQRRLPRK